MNAYFRYVLVTLVCVAGFQFPRLVLAQDDSGTVTETTSNEDGAGAIIISVLGAINTQVGGANSGTKETDINLGGGALVEFNVYRRLGIETGVLFMNQQYDVEAGSFKLVQQTVRMKVPVLTRFWFADFASVGAGPYVAFQVGDTETAFQTGGESLSLHTSADEAVEFGLDVATTLNLAITKRTGVFVEGRYSFLFGEENNESPHNLTGFLGVKFEI